jgi:hypothetical protein
LEQLRAQTGHESAEPWPETEKRLEQEFADTFAQVRGRVSGVQEFFSTGQMPLAEYVEWLLLGTEQLWALHGGSGQGLDMDAYQARTNRLTRRLASAGYESEADRRMRQEDPARYEFLSKSAELLLQSMDDADPQAHDNMIVEQMKLFRDSPMSEEAQQAEKQMREGLERLRDTHPDLYEQQIQELEQTKRFVADPAAAIQEMKAAAAANVAGDVPEPRRGAAPGQLLFRCGRRKKITKAQIRLFQELVDYQERLRSQIDAALRDMHRRMQGPKPFSWPGDRVLFPDDPDATDTPLQCFRIEHVSLRPERGRRIVLGLDTLFGHFEEHGCSMLIRNGTVERYGTWDDVFGDEDADAVAD